MQVETTLPARTSGAPPRETGTAPFATLSLFLALVTTGLSAGFFYAWQVGSIPGLRLLDDATYVRTMNAVNSTIRNFGFGFIFFGSVVFLLVALLLRAKRWRSLSFGLLGASLSVYVFGLLFVTFSVHVPLNVELLTHTNLTSGNVAQLRSSYETSWNAWHSVRTWAGVGSFVLLLGAVFFERRLPEH